MTTTTMNSLTCMICFEDSLTAGCDLEALHQKKDNSEATHAACQACLVTFLVHCENDRKTTVSCPQPGCEEIVSNTTKERVLGRLYNPKAWTNDNSKANAKEELPDPEFLAWLRENDTQQCQNCKVWIQHEDGCESMMCVCGYRFCWECQAPIYPKGNAKGQKKCSCSWNAQSLMLLVFFTEVAM